MKYHLCENTYYLNYSFLLYYSYIMVVFITVPLMNADFFLLKWLIYYSHGSQPYPGEPPALYIWISPSSITPDSTHQLIGGDCKTWSGCVRCRETYNMCSAVDTSWRGLKTTIVVFVLQNSKYMLYYNSETH